MGCSRFAADLALVKAFLFSCASRGYVSKQLRNFYCAVGMLLCLTALSCSNGPTPPAQSGIQFVTPSSSPRLDQGQSVTVTISSGSTADVIWSLQTAFGKPVGTLSNETSSSATYTAPDTVDKETQVTIVATSGTDTASLGVFIEPAPAIVGTSASTASSCPDPGSIVLASSAGTKVLGQTSAPGDLQVIESGGVPPYTWSIASGSLPAGFSLEVDADTSRPSIAGVPITPGCSSFTVQVTDSVGVTAVSQTINLVVIPAALKPNAPSFHSAFINASNKGIPYAPVQLLATGGTPPYSWSLVSGSAGQASFPPGLVMNAAGVVSGVPSAGGLTENGGFGNFFPNLLVSDSQYPYPAIALPAPAISVFDINDLCDTGSESNLKAQSSYAFQLRGFDGNGPVTVSGNFIVDGSGAITGGHEDINRVTGSQPNLTILPGSTYSIGSSKRGCVTLIDSAGTTTHFRIAMGGCSTGRDSNGGYCQPADAGASFYFNSGRMVEFDDSTGSGTHAVGIVRVQDPGTFQDSGISGMYAFGLSGWDAAQERFAMAGSATAGSGSFSAVAADTNDAGTLGSALTGGSGTFTVAADGRGTGSISVGTLSLNVVLYPVSSHEVMIATVGPPSSTNPLLSGEAIATVGPFNFQSLQNSHIFHIAGISSLGPDPSVGTLSFDGMGGFTGVEYENQAGTLSSIGLSGAYSMDSASGRFAFFASGTQNIGIHPLVGYVIPVPTDLTSAACNTQSACITGFLLSTDSTAQAGGLAFQTPTIGPPPPFLITSLQGSFTYGTDEPLDAKSVNLTGHASANPNQAVVNMSQDTSFGDTNYCADSDCVLLIPGDIAIGGYAINADGSGKFGGQTASVTNGSITFYIDESPLNSHPQVVIVQE